MTESPEPSPPAGRRSLIGGETRVVAIIGDPVTRSRSPAMHNAAFAALGLDWVYVALPVARGRGEAAVRAVPDLGLVGLNVTMPHKTDAARACDELTPAAAALGAVNTVVTRADASLLGDSTDGEGLVRALADEGMVIDGGSVVVLGAGGAARAIVRALGEAGGRVTVVARRAEAAADAAGLAPGSTTADLDGLDVGPYDLIVNATPLGMNGEPPPFDTDRLHPGQCVFDTVYPGDTPLQAAARAQGARAVGGIGMLVHQGALAFERFTGLDAPFDVMRAAATR